MLSLKTRLLIIANILSPIICFGILSFLSIGRGDYNQIFNPTENESLINPASFTFAIWGPIFLLLSIFLIYQAQGLFKSVKMQPEMKFVNEVSIYFVISTIMTSLWYITWLNKIVWLATIFMILYLISLVIGYLRLKINLVSRSKIEKIAVVAPWSMYTAWVTAATIVSITTFLMSIGFNNPQFILTNTYWAVLVLLVALLIYAAVVITRNDLIFGGVGIWTLIGILFEQFAVSNAITEVVITTVIGITVLSIILVYQTIKGRKRYLLDAEP